MQNDHPPLQGIKVVELARVLAGPWLGQTLADLGAEVVKVESPQGDETRQWGPPFIDVEGKEISAYFMACNRGKTSIVADFNDRKQLQSVKQLIGQADVVIQNFKVGGLAKFGLSYADLQADHPRLIYCSISGFGQSGPYANRAGYDFLVQGMSGIMDITGSMDGEPQKMGVAFGDIFTGLYGVIAVQAALWERQRSGKGQEIDLALLDCLVGVLANQGQNYLASGQSPQRMGNAHPNICPYAVFPASDGSVIIAVGNNQQFQRLARALDHSEWADDPLYADNQLRVQHRARLTNVISQQTAMLSKKALYDLMLTHQVPAAPINSIAETFADPQVQHRQLQLSVQGTPAIANPIRFSRSRVSLTLRPPHLAEHQHLLSECISANDHE